MERDGTGELVEVSGVVYGVAVRGRVPESFGDYLRPPAAAGEGAADSLELGYRRIDDLPAVEEIWTVEEGEPGGPLGECRFALFRRPDGFGLTVSASGRGLFLCSPRAIEIEWTAAGAGAAHDLFAYALPLWLETRGAVVLHASAVVRGRRAVGFLGASGSGKSVLAAEMARRGWDLLADDGMVLRRDARGGWRTWPGPPLLRLWPSGLDRLGIPARQLPRVHETLDKRRLAVDPRSGGGRGGSPSGSVRVAAVYLLERQARAGGEASSFRATRRDALVRLIEHSVAAAPAEALGLAERRFALLADFVAEVPVRRLRFSSGADSAARVHEVIARDLG